MATARAGLLALIGVVAGAISSWLLFLALPLFDGGYVALLIPFALVAAFGGWFAMTGRGRALGIGVAVGAALHTAFFVYLFAALRGLDTFD